MCQFLLADLGICIMHVVSALTLKRQQRQNRYNHGQLYVCVFTAST